MSTTSTSQGTIGQMMLMRRGGAVSYTQKVLGIQSANLIAYWPLSETSGTVADNAEGTAARDGTFARNVSTMGTTTGIGDGNTAPVFDGVNDFCNIYSASLATVFSGTSGTSFLWMKVSDSGVWSDGAFRRGLSLRAPGSNYVQHYIATNTTVNIHLAGGVAKQRNVATSTTDWLCIAMTWDIIADEVKIYFNGVQSGATLTGVGTWVGSLTSTLTLIGADSQIPTNPWKGSLCHVGLWNKALTAAQILEASSL